MGYASKSWGLPVGAKTYSNYEISVSFDITGEPEQTKDEFATLIQKSFKKEFNKLTKKTPKGIKITNIVWE